MHAVVAAVAAGVAFAASLTLTPLARKMAWKFGAVCRPDGKRKLHARPTPLGGGGAVYLAALFSVVSSCLLAYDSVHDKLPAALGLSAGLLCLLGAYDDLYDMPARWKLLGQIIASLPVVIAGSYIRDIALFGAHFHFGWFGIPLTIGWLTLGVNALNLLDGMDGLASMIGILIAVAVGAIAATQDRPEVMMLAFVLAGALAGFLVHNLPPALIYLGDCGSMVIGFTLALLALRVSLEPTSPTTARLTVAAALLFVPLTDTTLAIVRRSLKGFSFMVADRGHVHHQLLDRGWSNWGALVILGGFGLATGVVAWCVSVSGSDLLGWIALASIALFLASRRLLGAEEWTLAKSLFARTVARSMGRPSVAAPDGGPHSAGYPWVQGQPGERPQPVILKVQDYTNEGAKEPQEKEGQKTRKVA